MKQTLTYQSRASLPDDFVRFLEVGAEGELMGVTWLEPNRHRLTAHYNQSGNKLEDRVFRYKAAIQQSRRATE